MKHIAKKWKKESLTVMNISTYENFLQQTNNMKKNTFKQVTAMRFLKTVLCSVLIIGLLSITSKLKAQVITENFEGAGWTNSMTWSSNSVTTATNSAQTATSTFVYATGISTVAGVSVPSNGTVASANNFSWSFNAVSTGNATNNYRSSSHGAVLGQTSTSFICTPFMSGGVAVVTCAVFPTGATAKMMIGVNTIATTASGPLTSTVSAAPGVATAIGNWNASAYVVTYGTPSSAGNLTSNQWNTITFTTNIPASQSAYIKFQRVVGGTVSIDDIQVWGAPSVSSSPTSTSVCAGANATFSAAFTVPPTGTTYQWQYNDGVHGWANATNGSTGSDYFTNATTTSLTVNNVSATSNNYQYQCIATYSTLTATTNAATLTIKTATSITSQPSNASYNINAFPVTALSVSAAFSGTAVYQWYSSTDNSNSTTADDNTVGTNSSSYTPDVSSNGVTYYYCKVTVTGGCGTTATSNAAKIAVCQAPSFTAQPNGTSVCVNNNASLGSVAATNSPTWQWYSNTTNSTSGGSAISGETANSYSPPTSLAAGTYYYYVNAINGNCTSPSSVVQYNVYDAPTFTSQPSASASNYSVGYSATALSVSVTGYGLTYQWYSNSSNSNSGGSLISGATANSYTPSTTTLGTTYYYCVVSSTCHTPVSSNVSGAINVVPYVIGDLGSVSSSAWGTAATWKKWDGIGWNTTGNVPTASDNVWITDGSTVSLSGTTKTSTTQGNCNNLHVMNGSLIANSLVNSYQFFTVNGTIVEVGASGHIGTTSVGDAANGLSMYIVNTSGTTITGSGGTIDFSKLMLSSNGATLTIDYDVTVHYHSVTSGLDGSGQAFGVYNTASNTAYTCNATINAGKTLTFDQFSNFCLGSSQSGLYNVDFNLTVNGTMNFTRGKPSGNSASTGTNGSFVLNSATGHATNVTIGSTGTINATEFYPNGNGQPSPAPVGSIGLATVANITVNGNFNIDSLADFRVPGQTVTGTGTFRINNSTLPVLKIGSTDGITVSASAGPIQTTTRVYPTTAFYTYEGTAAQVTGDGLPSSIAGLMVNNAAGVTLTGNATITDTLWLTNGILSTGSNLINLSTGYTILGGGSTSYVNGQLTNSITGTSPATIVFPIGKSSVYSPVILNITQSAATATTYTAEAFVGGTTPTHTLNGLSAVSTGRYYHLSSSSSNISTGAIRLHFGVADAGISISDLTNIKIAGNSGSSAWSDLGYSIASPDTITSSVNITSLNGDFVLANAITKTTAPALVAAVNPTVDANFNITFTDDSNNDFFNGVQDVYYGSNLLVAGTDYSLAPGVLTLKPGGSVLSGLRTAGTQTIYVTQQSNSIYDNGSVVQPILAGVAHHLTMKTQPTAPVSNTAVFAVQPAVYILDQYNNITTSNASVTAMVGAGNWVLGGTVSQSASNGTVTFTGLTASEIAALAGATMSFSSTGLTTTTSASFNLVAPTTYYWVGGTTSAAWTAASVWSTTKGGTGVTVALPKAYDTFIFDNSDISSAAGNQTGNVTVTVTSANSSILNVGNILMQNNANVTISSTGTRTINVGNVLNTANATVLSVPAGSTLTLGGNTSTYNLLNNSAADIYGNLNLGNGKNIQLIPGTTGSTIVFENGSACVSQQLTSTTLPFGSTGTNVVDFKSGSTFNNTYGGDVFGGGNVAKFEHGSTYYYNSSLSSGLAIDGHTFGNLTINTSSAPVAGSAGFNIDTLNVTATGSLTIVETGVNNNIKGNISVATGGTLRFNPATSGTVNFNGSSAQSATGVLTVTSSTPQSFTINNANGFTLGTGASLAIPGTLTLTSGSFSIGANTLTLYNPIAGTSTNLIGGSTSVIYIYGTATGVNIPSSVTSLSRVTITNANGTALQNNLTLASTLSLNGGPLSIGNHTLTLGSSIAGAGAFTGSANSNLVLTASASQHDTIRFTNTTATDSLLNTLSVTGATHITLGTGVGITNLLSLSNAGAVLNLNGNYLTLKSTATQTAEVGNITAGASITDTTNAAPYTATKITVERYIPKGKRNYRDLGPTVANAGSVFANWQENGIGSPSYNYGVYVTGKTGNSGFAAYDPTTGFDYTTNGNTIPSLYSCVSGNWAAVTTATGGTKGINIDPFRGLRLLIRGARNFNMGTNPANMPSATTLRATGSLVTGTVTFNAIGNGGTVSSGYTSSYGLTPASSYVSGEGWSFVANPFACPVSWSSIINNAGTTGTNVGNFYCFLDPTYQNGGLQRYVTVQYNGTAFVTNRPAGIASDADLLNIQPGQGFWVYHTAATPKFVIRENDKVVGGTQTTVFRTAKSNMLNVSIWKDIEGVSTSLDETVAIFDNNYSKSIGSEDVKKLMNGGENISIVESNTDLSINGIALPSVSDEIALKVGNVIANTAYQLKVDACQFAAPGVQVFIKDALLNTIVTAETVVNFTPTTDANTYKNRFSVVFKSAKVVPVTTDKGNISIYPNPVTSKIFTLQTANVASGKYNVLIVNSLGQEVFNNTITHNEGSTMETIKMNKSVSSGLYTVVLRSVEGKGVYNTELIAK